MKFDSDDPKWTAYVLGELEDEAERADLEAFLRESAEARTHVEEIRSSTVWLAEGLRDELDAGLTDGNRGRILQETARKSGRLQVSRFRALAGLGVAAALMLAVLAATQLYRHRLNGVGDDKTTPTAGLSTAPGAEPLETARADPAIAALSSSVSSPHSTMPSDTGKRSQTPDGSRPVHEAKPAQHASLSGRVMDMGSGVITGAEVQVVDAATGATERAVSRPDGTYAFANLRPGIHTLTASAPGFSTQTITGVALHQSSPSTVDIRLGVGGLAEMVTVESTAPPIMLESSTALIAPSASIGIQSFGNPATRKAAGALVGSSSLPVIGGIDRSQTQGVAAESGAGEISRPEFNTEAYDYIRDNPFLDVQQNPLSTFSIDVDTASYANVRRFLNDGMLPPKDAVRIEELINYFAYDYARPDDGKPFAAHMAVADAPWNPAHMLLRIGLKGRELGGPRPPANLVFLLDVSGSMASANKLPLVKESMRLLVDRLTESDNVAIVVYAGASGLALPSTNGQAKEQIREALDRLEAGGSTNGASGIELAYRTAQEHYIRDGVNRVILATDGDFNVGISNRGDLTRLIEEKAKSGIFLSALGFGMGNYKDSTLEMLADKGNGNYAYIDNLNEARKILVDQIDSTLVTIAKDVKIQIEFNPAEVGAYRLIGYENRILNKEDFNDDTKDAGEIGAGHTVTALYELVPPGSEISGTSVDPLKYQPQAPAAVAARTGELLTLKIRYKEPDQDKSLLSEYVLYTEGTPFSQASSDFKFAAAVAAFGMVLRDSPYKGSATLEDALQWAQEGSGADRFGYREEFIHLIHRAISIPRR